LKGYITRDDFLQSALVKRIATKSVSLQDVLDYLVRDNLFNGDAPHKMDIETF
jgi:HD superfamily phosphohydrolase